jgi:hypothetical protein
VTHPSSSPAPRHQNEKKSIPPKSADPLSDFRNFLFLVWRHLNLPSPTPVQYDLASYLQSGPRRRIIEAFRGVGKSYITVAYVVWRLYRNPQLKIEVVSASKNLADNFTTLCLQLIDTMDVLEHLRPSADQRNSKIQFDVRPATPSKDPSVKSVGITGQITGSRADVIVADDIETPDNSATQGGRDKLLEKVKEFDAVLKPDGEIIYLGTPQTEMSIYNELPKRGYEIRVWPARMPSEKQRVNYGDHLAPFITNLGFAEGAPIEPTRFHEIDLVEREVSWGRAGFALQFMLDTSLSDANRYPLKLSDLIVANVDPEVAHEKIVWAGEPANAYGDELHNVGFRGDRYYRPLVRAGSTAPYTGSVLAIDPSGRGADETGYAVIKMLNGYLHCPDAGGLRGGYDEPTLVRLAEIAKEQKVNRVIIEANFGDGMFTALFKPVLARIYPCTIEEVKHSIQKEKRIIDTLEPVLGRHRLIIDPKVILRDYESTRSYPTDTRNQYMLFWQLSRITKERGALRHDDRLDALAIAVAYWTQQMSQDEDRQADARREELLKQELQKFQDHALGRQSRAPTWMGRRK